MNNNLKLTSLKFTEADIKSQVKDYLKIMGIFNFFLLAGMGAYKGNPDRIIFYKGQAICVEFKTEKGKQSEHQFEFQRNCEANNIRYVVVRKVEDIKEVIEEIKTYEKS